MYVAIVEEISVGAYYMSRKSGVILAVVLMMFLVLSILATTLMIIVASRSRQANEIEKRTHAYFHARSGIEILRGITEQMTLDNNTVLLVYGDLRGADEEANFSVVYPDFGNSDHEIRGSFEGYLTSYKANDIVAAVWRRGESFNFISAGNAGDITRIITFHRVEGGEGQDLPEFDMAVFARTSIRHEQGVIDGSIGTNSTAPGAIHYPNNSGSVNVTQDIYVGPGGSLEISPRVVNGQTSTFPEAVVQRHSVWGQHWLMDKVISDLEQERDYQLPDMPSAPDEPALPLFPQFPALPYKGDLTAGWWPRPTYLSEEGRHANIQILAELIIQLEGSTLDLVADIVTFGGSGELIVEGPGTLNLYVSDSINTSSGSITLTNGAKLNIFAGGDFKTGNSNLAISNLYVSGSGEVDIDGTIVTEKMLVNTSGDFKTRSRITVQDQAVIKAEGFSSSGSASLSLENGLLDIYVNEFYMTANTSIDGIEKGMIVSGEFDLAQGSVTLNNEESDLKIYVKDSFNMGGSSKINDGGNPQNTILYYQGIESTQKNGFVDLSGAQTFVGTFFMRPPKSNGSYEDHLTPNLKLTGGSNVIGTVITSSPDVEVTGGSSTEVTVLYAPDSAVKITGGGKVYGAIVSDTFTMSGGATVVHPGAETLADYIDPDAFDGVSGSEGTEAVEEWGE